MLRTQVMSEEDNKNYLRPTIYESIRKVLRMYGLSGVSKVYYNGEDEVSKLLGVDRNSGERIDIHTEGIYENKLYVSMSIEESPINRGYANSRRMMTESPVFFLNEKEVGTVNIYPGFEGIKVNISVNAGFNSHKLAKHMVNRINTQTDRQIGTPTFNSQTHLILNKDIGRLLLNIYELQKKGDPSIPDFSDWFHSHSQANWMKVGNPIGNHTRLAAPLNFNDIRIQFGEAHLQLPRRGSTIGKWEVEFTYSFYFNNFTHWELEYPLNVYQEEINEEFIPIPKETFKQAYARRGAIELRLLDPLIDSRKTHAPFYLKLPEHDPFVYNEMPWTLPFYQVRLKIKNSDANQMLVPSIFELPNLTWKSATIEHIKRVKERVFDKLNGPIHLMVLSDRTPIEPSQLYFNEDFGIHLNREPTLFNTHRFLITIDMRIRDWTLDFWEDVKKHPEDLEIVEELYPWYDFEQYEDKGGWLNNREEVIKEIDIGYGRHVKGMNIYTNVIGLFAYKFN